MCDSDIHSFWSWLVRQSLYIVVWDSLCVICGKMLEHLWRCPCAFLANRTKDWGQLVTANLMTCLSNKCTAWWSSTISIMLYYCYKKFWIILQWYCKIKCWDNIARSPLNILQWCKIKSCSNITSSPLNIFKVLLRLNVEVMVREIL